MDIATGSISLFQACLHAYRVIDQAIEVGSDVAIWNVLMRIELTRFEIWGRLLGFLDEETGEARAAGAKNQVADLADILQIEAARNLVRDILLSLKRLLDEFNEAARTYRLDPGKDALKEGESKRKRFEARMKRAWKSSKDFSMHLILIVTDKDKMKDLLRRLTDFNDGLEKVLSVSQRALSAKALSSGVLAGYDDDDHLSVFTKTSLSVPEETRWLPSPQNHQFLTSTAVVKELCLQSSNERSKRPLVKYALEGTMFEVASAPRNASGETLWPFSIASHKSVHGSSTVLVEWRLPDPFSVASRIGQAELVERRSQVVDLLHETNKLTGTDYRVLDCFGWFPSTGYTSNGNACNIIGFASRIPFWADTGRNPVSLNTLLTTAFESGEPGSIPSLRTRYQLALQVAQAVYQLLCSRWLHRTLSSHQIIFFYDEATTELRLDSPFLIGLQYSRPDDQKADRQRSAPASEGQAKNWGNLGLYLHPELSRDGGRRYRRSDDVYSLGMILFEIAFWEPVQVFVKESSQQPNLAEPLKAIHKTAAIELDAEVGPIYQNIVLDCLQRLQTKAGSDRPQPPGPGGVEQYDGGYQGEDPEYGLESDVLWRVVRQLEKCSV